jgi:hypothetical protein
MGTRNNPDVQKYTRVAKQRLDEAKLIHDRLQLWSAAQYLVGYSVECMLKALVLVNTPRNKRPTSSRATIEWMKESFGHDLNKLYAGLRSRSVKIPAAVQGELIYLCSDAQGRWSPEDRYEPGPGNPKDAARFLKAVETIVRWADRGI